MNVVTPIFVCHRKHEIQIATTPGYSRVHDKDFIDPGFFILKVIVFIENGSVWAQVENHLEAPAFDLMDVG